MAKRAAERYLQISIERVIDIGNEILSSPGLRRPERYRDVPAILAEAKVIPEGFAESVASMIGFRNLLVHDYALIYMALVYEFIQRGFTISKCSRDISPNGWRVAPSLWDE